MGVVFVVEDEDEGSSGLESVRVWIARPAELISFVTSCRNQSVSIWIHFVFDGGHSLRYLSYLVHIVQLSDAVSGCECLVLLISLLPVRHSEQ